MPRMRSVGEGTLRQRRNGSYEGRYRDGAGELRSVYGRTKKDVAGQLQHVLAETKQGIVAPPAALTLREHLETWLVQQQAGQHIRPKTYQSYEQLLRVHLYPSLGSVPIRKLSTPLLQRRWDEMVAAGKSRATVERVRAVLRASFGRRSPLKLAIADTKVARNAPIRHEKAHLGQAELGRILAAVAETPLYPLVLTAAYSGLRQSEQLALRWQDLDLATGVVRIRYQLQHGQLVEPKTETSKGQLILPPIVVEALRGVQAQQRAQGLVTPWVFATTRGGPLDGTNLLHRFQTALAAHGLPKWRWHDLRHAAGTILLEQGIDIAGVMKQLRHSQISLTANTYAHVTAALNQTAADAYQRAAADER